LYIVREHFDRFRFAKQPVRQGMVADLIHLRLEVLSENQELRGVVVDLVLPQCIRRIEVLALPLSRVHLHLVIDIRKMIGLRKENGMGWGLIRVLAGDDKTWRAQQEQPTDEKASYGKGEWRAFELIPVWF
jgi:hypothetical protein